MNANSPQEEFDRMALLPQMGTKERFDCLDCGSNTLDSRETYMVTDSVWDASGLNHDGGMLCFGCLESRIGRALTSEDFTDCLLNVLNERVGNWP